MTVALIIVNWNGADLLRRCLQSVREQRRPPDHVIVVDNASTDDSIARAEAHLRSVEVIRLATNTGFAHANNVGAQAARGYDALALMNPDVIADPGWLEALVAAAEADPRAAGFASRMLMASAPRLDGAGDSYHVSGRAWRKGHGMAAAAGPQADADTFGPCAAAALYRRDAFEEVGGFDEQFFCYFEDVDLAFRLRLRGYTCRYVHQAVVQHTVSAVSGYRSDFALYHGERNAIWTFVKNMPAPLLWMYLPQHVILNSLALVTYPWRGQGTVVWKAKIDALRGLSDVLRQRTAIQQARRVSPWVLRRAFTRGIFAPYFARYR